MKKNREKKGRLRLAAWIVLQMLKKEWFFVSLCRALDCGGMHIHKNPHKKGSQTYRPPMTNLSRQPPLAGGIENG